MKLGIKDISNIYLGSKEISKVYLGSKEVFSSFSIEKDLILHYNIRSCLDLIESKIGLNAKILTPCFIGNNSAYYTLKSSVEISETSVIDIDFAVYVPVNSNYIYLLGTGSSTGARIYFRYNSGLFIYTDANVLIATFSTLSFSSGGYFACRLSFNAGTIKLTTNGTEYNNATTPPSTWNVGIDYIGRVGSSRIQSPTKLYYLFFGSVYKFYFNQIGVNSVRLYDALNSNHATAVSVVAANKGYDNHGSTFPYDTGYSLWQKLGSPDIYVPFTTSGIAQNLTVGTDIPTGYSKSIDVSGSLSTMIPFDSMIGMNESSSANELITHFDRSNATIQTDTSRASSYYDSTSLATKSRYHITELIDPRIYSTYFNTEYNKYFGKITTSLISTTYYVTSFPEMLVYSVDMRDSKEHKIMQYCGTDVFEVLDGNGNYTVDGNNYVIIE